MLQKESECRQKKKKEGSTYSLQHLPTSKVTDHVNDGLKWTLLTSMPFRSMEIVWQRDVYLNKRERIHSGGSGPRVQGRQDLRNLTNIFGYQSYEKRNSNRRNRCIIAWSHRHRSRKEARSRVLNRCCLPWPSSRLSLVVKAVARNEVCIGTEAVKFKIVLAAGFHFPRCTKVVVTAAAWSPQLLIHIGSAQSCEGRIGHVHVWCGCTELVLFVVKRKKWRGKVCRQLAIVMHQSACRV